MSEELTEPRREQQQAYYCRCLILAEGSPHYRDWCAQPVPPDTPFCESCEDRHPEVYEALDTRYVAMLPIRSEDTTPGS